MPCKRVHPRVAIYIQENYVFSLGKVTFLAGSNFSEFQIFAKIKLHQYRHAYTFDDPQIIVTLRYVLISVVSVSGKTECRHF